MSLEHHFTCPLPNGFHARPASALEELSHGFASEMILLNQRTGRSANIRSVLAIIGTEIQHNDSCLLTVSGPDEQKAFAALSVFVKDSLPQCDDALPSSQALSATSQLPLILRSTNLTVHSGMPAVRGVAQGRLVRLNGFKVPETLSQNGSPDAAVEKSILSEALEKLANYYNDQLAGSKSKIEAALVKAHRAIVRDPEFCRKLHEAIEHRGKSAAGAIIEAEKYFSALLANSSSSLLRERTLDIQDVCVQLLRQIFGKSVVLQETCLTDDSIVTAESLAPSHFLALDRKHLKGLVLTHAGTTSHTVILARSFGIPTLVGVPALADSLFENQEAVLDADAGLLLTNLTALARRYYALEQQRLKERQARVQQFALRPATSRDGCRIEIAANITCLGEVSVAIASGAESIGLFRTEMLFLDRECPPDENEQFEAYRLALAAAGSRQVIFRTLDVGGDKPLEYLNLPQEENPFLGCRAVRVYPKFESIFRTQIRALIRASAHGQLKLMIPMIATLEDVRWVKKIISQEQTKCEEQQQPFDKAMRIGAMIEVPSAAFSLDVLCRELDFFSIGSNDLLQYFMAADRTNPQVAGLYNPLQPSFLRLLKYIADTAREHHRWIGLCGEIGGQLKFLPLLAGLGLDEISIAAPSIPGIKARWTELILSECQILLGKAMQCVTAEEVAALLTHFDDQSEAALITPELVIVNSEAATKEEVVKQAVDRLYVLGRVEDSRAVEDAVWQREQTYSTGFGHGFAIPHCKTSDIKHSSLVLIKLKTPVEWNSLDSKPVHTVILLAVREINSTSAHMKVLVRLARLMMNAEFRDCLHKENDIRTLCAFLIKRLAPAE